jgi:hypothetical protein
LLPRQHGGYGTGLHSGDRHAPGVRGQGLIKNLVLGHGGDEVSQDRDPSLQPKPVPSGLRGAQRLTDPRHGWLVGGCEAEIHSARAGITNLNFAHGKNLG